MSAPHSGRTALVTGASRGIGEAIARRLAADGAEVILVGRRAETLETVQRDIASTGGRARIATADLSRRDEVVDLARRLGPIDILINNAAPEEKFQSILTEDDAYWNDNIEISVWAPILLTRELGRGMVERRYGVILNMSSINAQFHSPYIAAYNVTKAAIETFTRCAAMELGPHGVRVNAIAPGLVRTTLSEKLLGPLLDQLAPIVPAARPAEVGEVAELAAYLCSDAASYANGAVFTLDGGMSAGNFALAQAATGS